jgi:DNA-binding GntR family transcriptional regulator
LGYKVENEIKTASDQVFVDIRQAIVEGEIKQGSKISEPELSKQHQVSRATLREALNRLESCHLIDRKANVGCRVISLTIEKLEEIYQVRSSLEGLACRLAAENMTDDEIAQVKMLLDNHLSTQRVRQGESYYQEEGDLDFHYRIIKGSKNAHLINLLCNELYQLVRMYRVQMGMNGPRVSKAFDEHLAIINAIEARDGELAELLMKRHISASSNNIENKFSKHLALNTN